MIRPAGADGVTVCRSTMLQEPAQRRHAALAARVKALAETQGTVSRHKVLRCFPDPSDCPSDSLRGLIKPVIAQPRNFTGIPALFPKIQRKPRGIGFIERQRVGQLLVPVGVKGLARRILFNVVRVASVMKAAFRPGCALQVSHGMAVFVRHHVPVKRLERTQVHFRHLFSSIAARPVKSLSWRGAVGDNFLENGRFGNACDGFDVLRQFIQGLENGPGVGFGFADVEFVVFMRIIRLYIYISPLIEIGLQWNKFSGSFKNINAEFVMFP